MEDFGNDTIHDIAAMVSAQSSKTQAALGCASWALGTESSPTMWVTSSRDEAIAFSRDRAMPTFEMCKPVAAKLSTKKLLEFVCGGVPFYFGWAGSKTRLQAKPIRFLFLDEVRNYPPGAVELAMKRTRTFWNARRVIISTPGNANDAVHRAYLLGDQRQWHFRCPACGELQPLEFERVKWDTNEVTRAPSGIYNFDALFETIRYECRACQHAIRDTPDQRRKIAEEGQFVPMNPTAAKARRSYHWNALLPPWVSWASIVEEFISARSALKLGDLAPFKDFVCETLGLPWEDTLGHIEDFTFLKDRCGNYDYAEEWGEELSRFMGADKQAKGGEHYYWVVRAVARGGKSRLVAHGKCNTEAELEEARIAYSVPAANAMIDSGFRATDVYRFCLRYGWKATKGDHASSYLHRVRDLKHPKIIKTIRKPWRFGLIDPLAGRKGQARKTVPLLQFSTESIADILAAYQKGQAGEWTLPRKPESEYTRQLSAERRVQSTSAKGVVTSRWKLFGDNHYLDCERQILAAMLAAGLASG